MSKLGSWKRKRDPDGKNTTCVRCGRFDVIIELFRSTSNDVHLLASYVFSQLVNFIQGGAYAARGVVIISRFPDEIAKSIIQDLDRGVLVI